MTGTTTSGQQLIVTVDSHVCVASREYLCHVCDEAINRGERYYSYYIWEHGRRYKKAHLGCLNSAEDSPIFPIIAIKKRAVVSPKSTCEYCKRELKKNQLENSRNWSLDWKYVFCCISHRRSYFARKKDL